MSKFSVWFKKKNWSWCLRPKWRHYAVVDEEESFRLTTWADTMPDKTPKKVPTFKPEVYNIKETVDVYLLQKHYIVYVNESEYKGTFSTLARAKKYIKLRRTCIVYRNI